MSKAKKVCPPQIFLYFCRIKQRKQFSFSNCRPLCRRYSQRTYNNKISLTFAKTKQLLLGDEALALGALNAGLSGAYAYPGTPSTEILEFVQSHPLTKERGIHSHWSSNEKTAVEEALGMSFCGKRSIVSMKHVGMNVAADAFVNSGMTGANGGTLVIGADDPSMHSSQNEQDSRFYAQFAFVATLEPSCQQECYDMARYGFELSEKLGIPVLVRLVTRLSHSRAVVEADNEPMAQNAISYPKNPRQWVLMPANSRERYAQLLKDFDKAAEMSETSPFNSYTDGSDKRLGIVVTGLAYNYLMETFPGGCPFPVVKVSQYPLPAKMIGKLMDECEAVAVIEEGQPFAETQLRGLLNRTAKIYGKLSRASPHRRADPRLRPRGIQDPLPRPLLPQRDRGSGRFAGYQAPSSGIVPRMRPPRRVRRTQRCA